MNNIEKIKFICSFLCSHLHSGYIINLNERLRQQEEATENEDTQRLVAEIEMLKVVLYLVCCKDRE
jgi:hypothetical protein